MPDIAGLPRKGLVDLPPLRRRKRKPRIGLFVDVANLFHSIRERGSEKPRIDYAALLAFAKERGQVCVAKAYTAYRPERPEEGRFLLALRLMGFRIVREPLKSITGENNGNLDTAIAFDIGVEARHLEEIILASGDGDFAVVVRRLHSLGKRVTIVGPDGCTNVNLIIESDEFIYASQVPGFVTLPSRTSPELDIPVDEAGALIAPITL